MIRRLKKMMVVVCFVAVWALAASSVAAQTQTDFRRIYLDPDNTYQLVYPVGWRLDASNAGFVILSGSTADIDDYAITVFGDEINRLTSGAANASEALATLRGSLTFINDDTQEIDLLGRTAATASITPDEGLGGYALVVPLGEANYGLLLAVTAATNQENGLDVLLDVAARFNPPTPETLAFSERGTLSLSNHNGFWEDAVTELRNLGVIGDGGGIVFEENFAFTQGFGRITTLLGRRAPQTNVVIAAQLEMQNTRATVQEECALAARVITGATDNVTQQIRVGYDTQQNVFFEDVRGSDAEDLSFFSRQLDITAEEPQHILYVLAEDRMTVFFNGEQLLSAVPVQPRQGIYALSWFGRDGSSRCNATNLWVYEIPVFEAGVCVIESPGRVNQRSQPSTTSGIVAQLQRGDQVTVIGQTIGADSFVWWQLEDESWVREDVVETLGDCISQPQIDTAAETDTQ